MWSRRALIAECYHFMDRSTLQIVGSSVVKQVELSDGSLMLVMDYFVTDY